MANSHCTRNTFTLEFGLAQYRDVITKYCKPPLAKSTLVQLDIYQRQANAVQHELSLLSKSVWQRVKNHRRIGTLKHKLEKLSSLIKSWVKSTLSFFKITLN